MLRFSCFVRRFLLSKLAGEPVCINLISFWTNWWFSLDIHFSFSTICKHTVFPSVLRFVLLPVATFCIAAFCSFWFSLLSWVLLVFGLVFRTLLLIALQLSLAQHSSKESFHFAMNRITCWFSLQSLKERSLLRLNIFQVFLLMNEPVTVLFICFTLLLPTFWVAFLLFFCIYRSICFLFISVVRQKPGFRFSLVLRFSCFVLRFQPLKLSGMPVCTNLINFRTVSLISEDFSFTFHIVQAHCYSFFPLVCFTLIVICSALLLSVWNVYHYWSELSLLLFKFSDIASDCFAAFFRNIFSCESFCFATDGITCWSSLQSLKERFVVVTT